MNTDEWWWWWWSTGCALWFFDSLNFIKSINRLSSNIFHHHTGIECVFKGLLKSYVFIYWWIDLYRYGYYEMNGYVNVIEMSAVHTVPIMSSFSKTEKCSWLHELDYYSASFNCFQLIAEVIHFFLRLIHIMYDIAVRP